MSEKELKNQNEEPAELQEKPQAEEATEVKSEETATEEAVVEETKQEEEVEKKIESKVSTMVVPLVPKEMGVADVVGLSVRRGREILPKIMDLKLLKYAYEEARQLAGKDSLCREINKRIKTLEMAR